MASMFAELEAAHAAEVEALYAEATAFMSDADVADQIAEIEDRRKETSYNLKHSTLSVREDTELLMALRGEQARRQRVADEATGEAVNLLDAVNQYREAATLNTVADFLCAAVASSTALDSVREGSVHQIAAE